MKKKIIAGLIAILMMTGSVIAYDLVKLSLSEASEAAALNDEYLKIDELNLKIATITYEEALRNARISEKTTYQGEVTSYYTPFIEETNVDLTIRNNQRNIEMLEKQVLALSYDYLINDTLFQQVKSNYQKTLEAYEKAKNDTAMTALELLQYEYSASALKISLDIAENTFNQTKEELFLLLGGEKILEVSKLSIVNPYDISEEAVIKSALEKNTDLYSKKRNLESREILLAITQKYYRKESTQYLQALANAEKAKLDYERQIKVMEVKIINDLENLKTKYDYIELEKMNNAIKKTEYEVAKAQYEKGYLSLDAYDAKKAALTSAENQQTQKEKAYFLALKDVDIYAGTIYLP